MSEQKPPVKLLVLPGDGVGPEIMQEASRVLAWLEKNRNVTFDLTYDLVGGASLAEYGVPIRDEVIEKAGHRMLYCLALWATRNGRMSVLISGLKLPFSSCGRN